MSEVEVIVEPVPGTELVHIAVGDRAGLVLTRREARDLGDELHRAAARSGRTARPRPRGRASAAA